MQLGKYLLAVSCALWLVIGVLYVRAEKQLHAVLLDDAGRVARLEAMIAGQRQVLSAGNCGEQERFWAALLNQQGAAQDAQSIEAARKKWGQSK